MVDWCALAVHLLIRFLHRFANLYNHGLIKESGSKEVWNACGAKLHRIGAANRVNDE